MKYLGISQSKIPKSGMNRKGLKQFCFSLTEGHFNIINDSRLTFGHIYILNNNKETIKRSPFQMTQTALCNPLFQRLIDCASFSYRFTEITSGSDYFRGLP